MMFQLEQEYKYNIHKAAKQPPDQHNLFGRQANAYQANTIKRSIIRQHDPFLFHQSLSPQPHNHAPLGLPETHKSKRRQKVGELAPLAQTISTVVFSNTPHNEEQQPSIPINEAQSSQHDEMEANQSKLGSALLTSNISKIIFHDDSEEDEDSEAIPSEQQTVFTPVEPPNAFFFSHIDEQPQNHASSDQFISLPRNRIATVYSSDSDDEELPNEEKKEAIRVIYRSDDSAFGFKSQQFCKHTDDPVQPNTRLQMILKRNASGFNSFWPEFSLAFQCQKAPLICAKKVSSKPSATFVLSSNPNNYAENSNFYLGKVKSNLFGDVFNFFGVGLNPSAAKENGCIPRELLATIKLNKIALNQPRQFEVFVKRPQYRYYLNFHQVTMYSEQVSLSDLYSYPENKQKIQHFVNRKAQLQDGRWQLDFNGRAPCKSVKNFIVEDQGGREVMMFGKAGDELFNIEVSHPLSVVVGMSVALSSFDTRMLYQE